MRDVDAAASVSASLPHRSTSGSLDDAAAFEHDWHAIEPAHTSASTQMEKACRAQSTGATLLQSDDRSHVAARDGRRGWGATRLRLLQSCRDAGCFDRIAVVALMAGAQLPVGGSRSATSRALTIAP
jgi:hypothetical protein